MSESRNAMASRPIPTPTINSAFGATLPAPLVGPRLTVRLRDTGPMALIAAMPQTTAGLVALCAAQGLVLPDRPGVCARSTDGTLAHCQSPGRWLVETSGRPLPVLDPATGSVTDLGHARASFTFAGEDAVELAQKLAAVDFAEARHGPMSFVQSGSDHSVSVALWRYGENSFVVYVERSFARDFWQVLEAESAEFRG